MYAGGVFISFLTMAMGAVRGRQGIMDKIRDVDVAVHAGEPGVNRHLKGVRGKNDRYGFSIDDPGGCGIEMALEAIGVGKFFPGRCAHFCQRKAG
jgi:hypothetical protein